MGKGSDWKPMGRVRVRGPLTPALGTMLKYYKDEVIEELQDEESRAGAARRHRQPRFVMSFLPGPPRTRPSASPIVSPVRRRGPL